MLFQIIELYYTLYNIVRTVFPNPSRALWTKELIVTAIRLKILN